MLFLYIEDNKNDMGDKMLNKKLHILKIVVEAGSFTAAAKQLYTSQPAVSRDIKQLEMDYEVTIFESTKNNLTLSSEGEVLYRYSVEIEAMDEHLINEIHEMTEQVKGDIRLGASHSYGEFVLPEILKGLHEEYPGVNCHVHIGNSQDIIDHLKDKTLDIGIIEIDKTYQGIELHPLFKDEMVLMKHRTLCERNKDLERFKCYIREPFSGTRYYQELALERMTISPQNVEINNTELIKYCVRNKLGFTILSRLAVEHENLNEMMLQNTGITRNFSAAVSKSKYISVKTQIVLNYIKSYLK